VWYFAYSIYTRIKPISLKNTTSMSMDITIQNLMGIGMGIDMGMILQMVMDAVWVNPPWTLSLPSLAEQCNTRPTQKYNNNNNNSQCRSRFRGVWRDPAAGNLTPTGISTHREVDTLRPTKQFLFFWKRFIKETITNQKLRNRKGGGESKINKKQRHTLTT